MKVYLFLSGLFLNLCLFGQNKYISSVSIPDSTKKISKDSATQFAEIIQASEMKRMVYYLASDSCEGRELGTKGNDRAADYIAHEIEQNGIPKFGLNPSYFQPVNFKWISWDNIKLSINDFEYKHMWDYLSIPRENKNLNVNTDEIVFLGYGIETSKYNDYKNLNLKDKVILIYNGEPTTKEGKSYLTGSSIPSSWSLNLDLKLDAAKRHGVKCILIIEDKFKELVDLNRLKVLSPTVVLDIDEKPENEIVNVLHLSPWVTTKLLGSSLKKLIKTRDKIKRTGRPQSLVIKTKLGIEQHKLEQQVIGRNILAYIEGSDKKDEVLIISAHYDHIGMRGKDVFNGADDNASGTTTVTQIAKAMQYAKSIGKGPRRSVLCLLVTGEEKGLLGSMYYVNNPVFPLSSTIADINIDMVGRIDDKYKPNGNYVYVIGSDRLSSKLHEYNESINAQYSHIIMDYTYNAENDINRYYYRSDHYNFAEKLIPAIFFFNGTHEDYHRIGDDPEKIDFNKMEKIGRHIFLLAWKLANAEKRISVDRK